MEYSSDAVKAASGLQTYMYMYTSMATFWTYDYICSLNKEWTFLRESRWTKVKYLYIVTRYVSFPFFIIHLYMNFINETPHKCYIINIVCETIALLSAVCSECFFILRTCALWNNSRIVVIATVFSFLAIAVSCVTILFVSNHPKPFFTSAIPGITGCYQHSNIQLFMPFLLLFVLGLELIILTFIRAIQNWRQTNGPLYAILLKHNLEYYSFGLFFSILNVLTSMFLVNAYAALFHNFQLVILAILATRMHLSLWHADRFLRSPDALDLVHISGLTSSAEASSMISAT